MRTNDVCQILITPCSTCSSTTTDMGKRGAACLHSVSTTPGQLSPNLSLEWKALFGACDATIRAPTALWSNGDPKP